MGDYPPRVLPLALFWNRSRSAITQWRWGFHTVAGPVDSGNSVYVPVLLELWLYGGTSDPGMRPYRPPVARAVIWSISQSAIGWWGWNFPNVRVGIHPRIIVFAPGLLEW